MSEYYLNYKNIGFKKHINIFFINKSKKIENTFFLLLVLRLISVNVLYMGFIYLLK